MIKTPSSGVMRHLANLKSTIVRKMGLSWSAFQYSTLLNVLFLPTYDIVIGEDLKTDEVDVLSM